MENPKIFRKATTVAKRNSGPTTQSNQDLGKSHIVKALLNIVKAGGQRNGGGVDSVITEKIMTKDSLAEFCEKSLFLLIFFTRNTDAG